MTHSAWIGMWLLIFTAVLVLIGCVLYVIGFAGFAQLLWVMASGTAGGGIVLFVETSDTLRSEADLKRKIKTLRLPFDERKDYGQGWDRALDTVLEIIEEEKT